MAPKVVGKTTNVARPVFDMDKSLLAAKSTAKAWQESFKPYDVIVNAIQVLTLHGNGYSNVYHITAPTIVANTEDYTSFCTKISKICHGCSVAKLDGRQTQFEVRQPVACKEFSWISVVSDLLTILFNISLIVLLVCVVVTYLEIPIPWGLEPAPVYESVVKWCSGWVVAQLW